MQNSLRPNSSIKIYVLIGIYASPTEMTGRWIQGQNGFSSGVEMWFLPHGRSGMLSQSFPRAFDNIKLAKHHFGRPTVDTQLASPTSPTSPTMATSIPSIACIGIIGRNVGFNFRPWPTFLMYLKLTQHCDRTTPCTCPSSPPTTLPPTP